MALSVAECDRMIAASERANRKLMIGYRCHFEPFNLAAMQLMRDKTIGDIQWIGAKHQYTMGPTSPAQNWRVQRVQAGGGALEDYGIYGVQAALYLTGEMPVAVTATTTTLTNDSRFEEIPATVENRFEFPSGAVADLATSYNAPGANEVLVRGSEGELVMRPATGYGGHNMTLVRNGREEDLRPGTPLIQSQLMMDHFAQAIRQNSPIIVGGDMGRRDVFLMEAIYRAAEQGGPLRL
jgi:predicted dehydrogenase